MNQNILTQKKNQQKIRIGRTTTLFIFAVISLVAVFMISISVGSVKIPLNQVVESFISPETIDPMMAKIIKTIRLPRTLATIAGGACLATAGVLLQIFFNNPIVEPYILGVSSGSSLFVGIVMLAGFKFGFGYIGPMGMFIGSFCGAIIVMSVVIFAAKKVKSINTLLIIGMMFGYVCSAATSILTSLADKERIVNFTLWNMGSFAGFTWDDVKLLYAISLPFILFAFLLSKPLNTFLLGERYAQSMGISIPPFRMLLVFISSVLTAVVTAFAGPVSFIGLAVPHIVRITYKTSNNWIIIPASCCFGGIMAAVCDMGARVILSPMELPLGAMTSIIGAPLLVFLLVRKNQE